MNTVSKEARMEIVDALRSRYRRASKVEKKRILNEFTLVSGYHRKHAIRLLRLQMERQERTAVTGQRVYNDAVRAAILVLWETADRICGKRLKAVVPNLVSAMEKHGHLKLDQDVRKKVLNVSAATIDRILATVRKTAGMRRKRREGSTARLSGD